MAAAHTAPATAPGGPKGYLLSDATVMSLPMNQRLASQAIQRAPLETGQQLAGVLRRLMSPQADAQMAICAGRQAATPTEARTAAGTAARPAAARPRPPTTATALRRATRTATAPRRPADKTPPPKDSRPRLPFSSGQLDIAAAATAQRRCPA